MRGVVQSVKCYKFALRNSGIDRVYMTRIGRVSHFVPFSQHAAKNSCPDWQSLSLFIAAVTSVIYFYLC
jgi:hypothetical protein